MFDDFDASLLSDPEFKEDAVREEIVVPIIKRLGFTLTGPNKIVRSKSLLHPFVMIGTKKHKVHIVPDYVLYSDGRPGLVLDAKAPDKQLVKSKHVEQAYSYSIHPEVRVRFYALCNGKQLVAYDTQSISPIFDISFNDIDREWDVIASVLSPENVSFAPAAHFQPDYGTAVVNLGTTIGTQWLFHFVKLRDFMCVHDDLFTMSATLPISDVDHLISFDADRARLDQLLTLTDAGNAEAILAGLAPGHATLSPKPVFASLDTIVGQPTRGQHDVFIPFVINGSSPLKESTFNAASAT